MNKLTQIISAEQIASRIPELASDIRDAYPDGKPLLVGVLKGSVIFLADLVRSLGDGYEMDFMCVSSYRESRSAGNVQIRLDLACDIRDRDVLIVEDIVDSGVTLTQLRELLATRHPRSMAVVTLLFKPEAYRGDAPIRFVGFNVPPDFVVGYGMDLDGDYRNLPYVATIEQSS